MKAPKLVKVRKLRGLVADVENKPGTYGPGDYTHPKLTAVGCRFTDKPPTRGWILRRDDEAQMVEVAEQFRECWDAADFIVGHNFRRHDVKILDGFYTGLGLPMLERKRIVDTYLDQPKMAGISRSLENLADRWGCPKRKMHLSERDWEQAYDGTAEGAAKMLQRVCSDVDINLWIYRECLRRGLL